LYLLNLFFCRQEADNSHFVETACNLVENARTSHSILCTSPSSIKCVFLKLNETLLQLQDVKTNKRDEKLLQKRAACLQQMLRTFRKKSVAIFDEVDVILHPLKSELTFSFDKSWIGEEHRHRYMLPEFLIHGVFGVFDETQGCSVSSDIRKFFGTMEQRYKKAIRNQEFIDADFYFEELHDEESDGHSIQWWVSRLLVCYLQIHHLLEVKDDPNSIADVVLGEIKTYPQASLQEPVFICAKWCQSLLPHVISKHHRYHYGLLCEAESQETERLLKAVPFLGKDLPSPDSEFSNLDVTIGFTVLSYMKQDLRKNDVRRLVVHLKERLLDGKHRIFILQKWGKWTSEIDHKYFSLELLDTEEDLDDLHEQLKQNQDVKRYYLQWFVLPKTAVYSRKSLSVGAPDFCNMFSHIIGFSGTPSKDLYPVRWKAMKPMPKFNNEHETKIKEVLTSPDHVPRIAYIDDDAEDMEKFNQDWKVTDLLENIAKCHLPPVSCLVDCGALITGFSNLEVAKYFMNDVKEEGFCCKFLACIFWDECDCPMAFERRSPAAIPLAACPVPMDKWFVYFDQVHTTGIDIKLPREAVAVVTIGRDTVLRDYVQACWRLRQFGEGQRVQVLLVPEIRRLVTKYTADNLPAGFTPKASRIDDAPFCSLEQESKVQNHGGLQAEDVYQFLSNRQDQQDSLQRRELLNLELRVWRRRRMHMMMSSNATEALDECFFQEHDEKGTTRTLQEPNACELTRQEMEEEILVKRELSMLQVGGRLALSCLDAQSVRQRQQEKQKESAKEIQKEEQKGAPTRVWNLSNLMSVNEQFFYCISTKFHDDFSFYPDFLYASSTFADALCRPHSNFILPNVEAIVEVKPNGGGQSDSSASGCIVFITLQEADTLCRLLRKTSDVNLQQRLSLFVFDSNGYCSNINTKSCLDSHLRSLFCSPIEELVEVIANPSRLHLGLAFARLFNCSLQHDVIQITWMMSWLHRWHSKRPHQTAKSVRDVVSSSFNKLAKYRSSFVEFKCSPFLMAATHDDLFIEGNFQTRWCPAIELMLRVAVQVNAFSRSFISRGIAEDDHLDLQREVEIAMQNMEDGAAASRNMVHVVRCD
jgi:hypothetical protein